MNELLIGLTATAWFLMLTAVQFWLISRINVQIRERATEIERLKKGIALVDDMDERVSKVRARSKENEMDVMRLERNLKKLSNTLASQSRRDQEENIDVALTRMADYIQPPSTPANEEPAPVDPEDELGYRG